MSKLLIINILFLFPSISLAQSLNLEDPTIFDFIYIQNTYQKEKNVINTLNSKIKNYQTEILTLDKEIEVLDNQISRYKSIYSLLLKYYYLVSIQTKTNNLFIISSSNPSNLFQRYNYLYLMINYIKSLTDYIKLKNEYYTSKKLLLDSYKSTLNVFLSELQNKNIEFDNKFKNYLIITKQMQQKSEDIRITMKSDYSAYSDIKFIIKNSSEQCNGIVKNYNFIGKTPITNPIIISSFGKHNHPVLPNIVINNDGIDLYSETDTIIKSVKAGNVVKVLNINNKSFSIIVNHGDYFSVYSNLSNVFVKEGDDVATGEQIASISKISSKYSFPCLNIQIWYKTEKLNPKNYLDL